MNGTLPRLAALVFLFSPSSGVAADGGALSVVPAEVVRVIDGDTMDVRARPWPQVVLDARVRVAGIDAPETFRPRCPAEKAMGQRATEKAKELLPTGSQVRLVLVEGGRLDAYGRVVADLVLADGRDLGAVLIEEGLAIAYSRTRPNPWC